MGQIEPEVKNWTHLCPDEGIETVVVTTKDGDRFVLTIEEAIAACQTGDRSRQFFDQFRGVMERLTSWLNERPEKIDRAYLRIGRDGLDFTVVLRAKGFDPELEDSLTELDIEIAQNEAFELIKLDITALPYCSENSARSFVRQQGTRMRKIED
jgi:hypothetical protein